MAAAPAERLRFTPRSLVVAVAMLGLTLALLRLAAASGRVIGWVVAAAAVAGLLHPLVQALSTRLPHGVAVALVAVGTLACVAAVVYGLVDNVVEETRALQRSAPEAAEEIERSGRFSGLAREFRLAERTGRFVKAVPERLRGGTPAEALRAAATRGVAFLATGVLTLFFLLHGPRLARAAADQVHDPARRHRLERVAVAAYHRAFRYALGTVLMAVAAGVVAYLAASTADLPGPVPLALWVALWDVVPVVGAAVGATPVVALAAVTASPGWAIALAVVFVAYQVLEDLVFQPRVERTSIKVGPFLTAAGGLLGLEVYGVGGALLAVLAVTLAAAAVDEFVDAP